MTHFNGKEWREWSDWFAHAEERELTHTLSTIAATIATGNDFHKKPAVILEEVENALNSYKHRKA